MIRAGALKISKLRLVVCMTQEEDEEGFALSFGYDAHRDAATSGSVTVRLKPPLTMAVWDGLMMAEC